MVLRPLGLTRGGLPTKNTVGKAIVQQQGDNRVHPEKKDKRREVRVTDSRRKVSVVKVAGVIVPGRRGPGMLLVRVG